MNKLIAVLLLTGLASTSQAARTDSEKSELCRVVKELAEVTMDNRLSGVDVVESMRIANSASSDERALVREIVIKAYSSPNYKTDEYKESAIKDFGTEYYLDCIKHAK